MNAYGLAVFSASLCLFFGSGWTERTILQALVIVMVECVSAVLAAILIALLSLKIAGGGGHSRGINPVFRSLILGVALGPVGGALAGILALMSLGSGAPGSAGFWTAMLGVERMFALAGAVAASVFWFMTEKRHIAPSKVVD